MTARTISALQCLRRSCRLLDVRLGGCLAVALALQACPAEDEGSDADKIRAAQAAGSPQEAADNFQPCGGEPGGAWILKYLTIESTADKTEPFDCADVSTRFVVADPEATLVTFSEKRTGRLHFFGILGRERQTYEQSFPEACADADACAAAGCTASLSGDRACVCEGEVESDLMLAGWWALEGDRIAIEESAAPKYYFDYCESGDRLVLRYETERSIWTYVVER
jgi:hypothetical protein